MGGAEEGAPFPPSTPMTHAPGKAVRRSFFSGPDIVPESPWPGLRPPGPRLESGKPSILTGDSFPGGRYKGQASRHPSTDTLPRSGGQGQHRGDVRTFPGLTAGQGRAEAREQRGLGAASSTSGHRCELQTWGRRGSVLRRGRLGPGVTLLRALLPFPQ